MMPRLIPLAIFLLSLTLPGKTQSITQDVLIHRLCKTWKVEKMMSGTAQIPLDQTPSDFLLMIKDDKTVLQGMEPDGFIKGTWEVNSKSMMLTIKDDYTSGVYLMKILSISANELVLEDQNSDPALTIYYHSN